LSDVEKKQLLTDEKFEQVFKALEKRDKIQENGIFYDGQIFDAYVFVSEIIRQATNSIVLIDNYIDETVFTLFTKIMSNMKLLKSKNLNNRMTVF